MRNLLASAARIGVLLSLAACAAVIEEVPAEAVVAATPSMPVLSWGDTPEGQRWTADTIAALREDGRALLQSDLSDIGVWCPGYEAANLTERESFWAGLLSALAKHESTWNPAASGGGGKWIGLVQISPQTARGYGCDATSVAALKDGSANLACAVKIAAVTVPRDGVVASGRRGLAADWAPFLNDRKRADMVAWTRAQPYCQAQAAPTTAG